MRILHFHMTVRLNLANLQCNSYQMLLRSNTFVQEILYSKKIENVHKQVAKISN